MAFNFSYLPPPLLSIPQWYPFLISAARQHNQDDLGSLYTLATTFTFVLCRSILAFSPESLQALHTPPNPLEVGEWDHFCSIVVRILLLKRHLLALKHVRRGLRLSRAWHFIVLNRLRRLVKDFEVKQRIVATGKVCACIFALLGFAPWICNGQEALLSRSTTLATFTSVLIAVGTAVTSTIGHGTISHLPLFQIEDSMRTMKCTAAEAGLTSWIVSETLVSIEQCVQNLEVQCSSLIDALCICLRASSVELEHNMVHYTEGWKLLEKETRLLDLRMQRGRRRWQRQGSARRMQRLWSLFS